MKYCVTYNSRFRHLQEVDEIILPYSAVDGSNHEGLISFIEHTFNKSQKIIIQPQDSYKLDKAVPAIKLLIHNGWNMAVKVNFGEKEDLDEDLPVLFNEYPRNMEEAQAQAVAGASDIYITESLGFRLKDLQRLKELFNVQLRVIPNIAQCCPTARNYMNPMQKFFVRPEDTEIYEEYIDVFELMGGQDNTRLSVVYEIYKEQQWLGNLNDVILDFGDTIVVPNTGMNPHFASMRLNCGKACLYTSCRLCQQMGQLAQSFNEVGIEVIKPRKKPERTEEEKKAILDRLGDINGSRINEETMLFNRNTTT